MKCLLLACLLAVFAPMALGSLIVGGDESVANSRPYQAALFDWPNAEQSYFYCGGTLISDEWVVSAGHCSFYYIYVGLGYHDKTDHSASGQEYIPGTWYRHPGYDSQTLDNDIALIKLQKPATLGGNIQAISISSSEPRSGEKLLVSGWGALNSGDFGLPAKLREVEVDFIEYQYCNNAYSGGLTTNMFCAGIIGGGKDACQGDSGGPIVSDYGNGSHNTGTLLKGIVSWGYGCAHSLYPGVYTNIAKYCTWISETTGGAVNCK